MQSKKHFDKLRNILASNSLLGTVKRISLKLSKAKGKKDSYFTGKPMYKPRLDIEIGHVGLNLPWFLLEGLNLFNQWSAMARLPEIVNLSLLLYNFCILLCKS